MQAWRGSEDERKSLFEGKYPDLAGDLPALFAMACRPNMNMEILSFMIKQARAASAGGGAAADPAKSSADERVGEHLLSAFVTPSLARKMKQK